MQVCVVIQILNLRSTVLKNKSIIIMLHWISEEKMLVWAIKEGMMEPMTFSDLWLDWGTEQGYAVMADKVLTPAEMTAKGYGPNTVLAMANRDMVVELDSSYVNWRVVDNCCSEVKAVADDLQVPVRLRRLVHRKYSMQPDFI